MRYQKVKYTLINNDTNTSIELENDPKEWDNSNRTLKREKTFGVMTELSKNLVFVKDGADFLKQAYAYKGGEADVTLEEVRFHPKTSHPYLHSTGTFDFSQYTASKLEVKVPFKSGGLNALIKSQQREEFELERLEAINGNEIDEVVKKTVALTSRKILLVSSFELTEDVSEAFSVSGQLRTIKLDVVANSDSENITYVTSERIPYTDLNNLNPDANQFFYFNSDVAKTLNIKLKFDAFVSTYQGSTFDAYILQRDINDNTVEFRRISPDTSYEVGVFDYSVDADEDFDLSEGDSLMIVLQVVGNSAGSTDVYGIHYSNFSFIVTEESIRDDSQTEAVLMRDIGEKLMQIIVGEKNRFYSNYLTVEKFEKLALTTGFWVRQFYYEITEEDGVELPKYAMQISLDQFLTTLNAVCNTGYHIETIDGVEKLVVEDLKYYFQPTTAIILDQQVTDLEYENADDLCHSSLEFGYDDDGEYDEAMGLDEPNIKTGFTTPLIKVDTKYSKISKAIAGTYPKEFARRKLKEDYPTTDTSYDKKLMLLDLKEGLGDALEERIWQDDFEQEPTGVFSPETITNLRLSPSQNETRHQWFYGTGVLKHQDDKIRYSNTEGNNSLSTKEIGKELRSERGDINISDLEKARFEPKYATFKHPLDYDVIQQLNGKTKVGDREIPNVYFKIQFIDDEGKKQTGYLMQQTQKQNNLGEFKLLIAV